MVNTSVAEKHLDSLYRDIHDSNFSEEAKVWYRQTYENAISLFTEVGITVSEDNGKHHVSYLSEKDVVDNVQLTLCKMKANTESSVYSSEARSFYKQMYENAVQLFTEIGAYTSTETNSKLLAVVAQYLCPEPSIINLYVPKARRALLACYGVECTDDDIKAAYGLLKEKLPDCPYDLNVLKKYIDDNYTTLTIGKRYTWEEICNECPYRYVFLSDVTYRGQANICNGIFHAVSMFEDIGGTYERLTEEGILVEEFRWTCGNIDGSGVYATF